MHFLHHRGMKKRLFTRRNTAGGDKIELGGFAFVFNRGVEGQVGTVNTQQIFDFLGFHLQRQGKFFQGGIEAHLLAHLLEFLPQLRQGFGLFEW